MPVVKYVAHYIFLQKLPEFSMSSFGSFYTINEGPKNDLSIKNQAVFEEKYSAQHILLLASQESRKMLH